MRTQTVLYGSLAIAAVALFVACGESSPTRPSPPSPSPFASIEVIGPDAMSPGESVQFMASIRQADGTTKSPTSLPNLRWRSSNPPAISVSNTGMVTAGPRVGAEAVISAEIRPQGVRGTLEVWVQPAGSGPRPALNGPYSIAVEAVSPCSLDSALQHRTYDAVLTTTGTVVDVQLTEPRFLLDYSGRGNRFRGRVFAGGAMFSLDSYGVWFEEILYPNLVERLEDNMYLVVEGNATTTGSAAGLSGTLDGRTLHMDSRFPAEYGSVGGCSGTIQFRVTPR
jgi:hypothetical protein